MEQKLKTATTKIEYAKEITDQTCNSIIHILCFDLQKNQFFNIKGASPFKDGTRLVNLQKIVPEKEAKKIRKSIHSIAAGSVESSTETLLFFDSKNQNHLLYYHCKFYSKRDSNGKPELIYCTLVDITPAIEQQKKMQMANSRQQLLLCANQFIQWNYSPATHEISIYKKDGSSLLLKEKITQLLPRVHPNDQAIIQKFVAQMDQFKVELEAVKLRLKYHEEETTYKHIEISAISVKEQHKVDGYIGLLKDITICTQQKEQLEKSNQQLKLMLAVGKSIGVTWNIQKDTFTTLCPSIQESEEDYSRKTDNITLQQLLSGIHPAYKLTVTEALMAIKRGSNKSLQLEIKYDPNGVYKSYKELYLTVVEYVDGQPSLAIGFCQDVTEKVISRQKIENQKKYIFTILDSIPTPTLLLEAEGKERITYTNKASIQLEKKIEKESLAHLFETTLASQGETLITLEESMVDSNQHIKRVRTKQGKYLDLILHKHNIEYNGKKYTLGTIWDITKINQLQERNNQLINSISLMKAYTWTYDSSTKHFYCDNIWDKPNLNLNSLDKMDYFYNSIHPDDRMNYQRALKASLKDPKQKEFHFIFRFDPTRSSTFEWWENKAIIERKEENGESQIQLWGLCYNINPIKQNELKLQETEKELELLNKTNSLILDNAQAGLIFVDNNQVIKWENLTHVMPSLSFSKKIKKQEQLYFDFIAGIDMPFKVSTFYRSLLSGKTEKCEHTTPEGIVLEASTSPVFGEDGERVGSVVRLIDVTDKSTLLKKIQTAKEEAERLNKLKSSFIANVSHEIRTPLNAIYGFSQLFEDNLSQQEKKEYLKIIKANNELLLNLINSILDLSKIESGVLTLKEQKIDFALLFNKIAQSMQQSKKKQAVELIVENPYKQFPITIDKDKITQIIINYVSNAIKYTPKGSIQMGYTQKENGLYIYVKDTGIGIPLEKQQRVFERFEKLDCYAQGTGLGLSICKAIAQAYKGKVGFTSKEGVGSTFWAWIPLLETKEQLLSK
ncbi:MAG: PAS domain-containing sensor histidine kinase [Bacteroidaceae bacterium]